MIGAVGGSSDASGGVLAASGGSAPAAGGGMGAGGAPSAGAGDAGARGPDVGGASNPGSGGALLAGGGSGAGAGSSAMGGETGLGGIGSGGEPASGGQSGVFPEGVNAPRIMIVGDSIAAGPGCYKKYLLQALHDNGYSQFEFVGEYEDDCGGGVRHSAVSCATAAHFTQDSFSMSNCFVGQSFPGMAPLVANHEPDLILMQLGVNDVWGGSTPPESVLSSYATLVSQAREHNPRIVVAVAQIHKIITDGCSSGGSINPAAEQLVNAVPGWVEGISTTESPVLVADLWTNSDPHAADDCVHPNDGGAQRMGLDWYHAIEGVLPRE